MAARSRRSEESGRKKDLLRSALGEVLREFRKGKPDLSQTLLSAQAGLPPNAIGDLERAERTIKAAELRSICRVLEIPLKVFLEELTKAQLRAFGEPEPNVDSDGTEMAPQPSLLYFGVAVTRSGGDLDTLVKTFRRMIRVSGPANPEEDR